MINYRINQCHKCGGNCWGCFYADQCNNWLDIAPYYVPKYVPCEIFVVLCESRHDIPEAINGVIFPTVIEDPMNFGAMYETVRDILSPCLEDGVKVINVYVTGMTSALLQVINWCRKNNVRCVTWHFDKTTGDYKKLPMD